MSDARIDFGFNRTTKTLQAADHAFGVTGRDSGVSRAGNEQHRRPLSVNVVNGLGIFAIRTAENCNEVLIRQRQKVIRPSYTDNATNPTYICVYRRKVAQI